MKVLVVGGAGFIGSYLCEELLKTNNFVVAYDNLLRGKKENLSKIINNDNFVFVNADANNTALLKKIVSEYKIEYIFHLAANSDIQASSNDPSIEFSSTVQTTWSILYTMKSTGVKRIFFASTSAVYGELVDDTPFVETDTLNPISYYGAAKMASEAFIKSFSYMNNLDALIFRFPNVIGPNLTHGVFYDFINRLKTNPKELVVLGDGSQYKPYMHVRDLVDAILLLCWDNSGVNTYNVGVETATYVKTIAEIVVNEMNLTNCKIKYGTENVGWRGDVPKFAYCLNKIHSTGWRATMTSDEACLLTVKEALGK